MPRHRMARDVLHQSGLHKGESQSGLNTPCEKIEPLKNAVRLRRAQASSSHDTSTAAMDMERNDALTALAVLARCRGSACGSAEVRARMLCRPTAWRDRVALLQAVEERRSSQTVRIFDSTSDGQLHLVLARAAVQWFAALCRVCRARAIARLTSCGVCVAGGRCLRLSGASRLGIGGPLVSETHRASTVVAAVAV